MTPLTSTFIGRYGTLRTPIRNETEDLTRNTRSQYTIPMVRKLSPKDAEKLRRRAEAERKRNPQPELEGPHYVCEDPRCRICEELDTHG